MRSRLLALLLVVGALVACGKYGRPVRGAPAAAPAPEVEASAEDPDRRNPAEEDEREEAPR